jgi:hypothetical protein
VGLERGPLSLVSTNEELLERKSSGSGLEIREYDRRGTVMLTTWYLLSANVNTNFAASCGCSVVIVRSWTQATELI